MKIFGVLLALALNLRCSSSTLVPILDAASSLEELYVDDCNSNTSPHGFYGAFFQPCEFSFFRAAEMISEEETSGCSTDSSTLISSPKPIHWIFKLSEHIENDDWDSLSSDDFPDFDDLMLWPDQCVGVAPRCYELGEGNSKQNDDIIATLEGLFPDNKDLLADATHVQVDCRADAWQLARISYSLASGAEKSLPTIVAWLVTVLLVFLLAMSFCCYGCCRLFMGQKSSRSVDEHLYHSYDMLPATVCLNGMDMNSLKFDDA